MGLSDITIKAAERREMCLFFLVDTSGSMEGAKIASVNQAIREALPIINEISESNADALIKVAVLEFADDAKWMLSEPIESKDFQWVDMGTHCLTSLGKAFTELNDKMSRSKYLSQRGYFPAVILLSDGAPTDNYKLGLDKLKDNKWFENAIKVAIAIGSDADKNVLAEFTGSKEAVFEADNVYMLKSIIRLASVTSSIIGSQSQTTGEKTKQEHVIDLIKKEVEDIPTTSAELDAIDPAATDDDIAKMFEGF